METTNDFLKDELTGKGLRPSYHRLKVLAYLHDVQSHPTADEIFAFLSPQIPSLSKATIYNTLNSFVEAGLARLISIDGLEKRYDAALHNHGHFQCESCGAIFNFKINIDRFAIDDLALFEIKEKDVYFKGLCPDCRSQGQKQKE